MDQRNIVAYKRVSSLEVCILCSVDRILLRCQEASLRLFFNHSHVPITASVAFKEICPPHLKLSRRIEMLHNEMKCFFALYTSLLRRVFAAAGPSSEKNSHWALCCSLASNISSLKQWLLQLRFSDCRSILKRSVFYALSAASHLSLERISVSVIEIS